MAMVQIPLTPMDLAEQDLDALLDAAHPLAEQLGFKLQNGGFDPRNPKNKPACCFQGGCTRPSPSRASNEVDLSGAQGYCFKGWCKTNYERKIHQVRLARFHETSKSRITPNISSF